MSVFVDTSVLVAALTHENSTSRAQLWLSQQSARQILISDWVVTEFSAALSVKLRMAEIDRESRSAALAKFEQLRLVAFEVRPVGREHFRKAARLADSHQSGLRAGDALHLAIAESEGARIATLDRRLANAAATLGLAYQLI